MAAEAASTPSGATDLSSLSPVFVSDLKARTSPGGLAASRAGAVSDDTAYIALDAHLARVSISVAELDASSVAKSAACEVGSCALSEVPDSVISVTLLDTALDTSIQSVAARLSASGAHVVAAVDQRNVVSLHINDATSSSESKSGGQSHTKRRKVASSSATPSRPNKDSSGAIGWRPSSRTERCWTGVALNPTKDSAFATVNMLSKDIYFVENGREVRQVRALLNPAAVHYITIPQSNEPLLAVAEQNMVSIWDVRVSENSGRLQELQASWEPIYALSSNGDHMLGAAGVDKTVQVYDTRKWSIHDSWRRVMKYEITSLHFSSVNPSLCYVASLDHEVTCGSWRTPGRDGKSRFARKAFRGDSRWVGVAKAPTSDTLFGLTESGRFYTFTQPQLMYESEATGPDTTNALEAEVEE